MVINDIKMLAQADVEPRVSHFLTKDRKINAKVDLLSKAGVRLGVSILDLNTPMADILGQFSFPE